MLPLKTSSAESMAPRKVRNACKRCRLKRIKCDGQIPACGNCSKANESCVDVDTRNNAVSIPRDFAVMARARIHWLEQEIKRISPNFDTSNGPAVDFRFMENYEPPSNLDQVIEAVGPSEPSTAPRSDQISRSIQDYGSPGHKRSLPRENEQESERPLSEEARSVAFDLGMLSLNSDSRQTHYLGSSSGRLFTSLVGFSSTVSTGSMSEKSAPSPTFSVAPVNSSPYASLRQFSAGCRQLFGMLKKNLPSRDDSRLLLDIYIRSVHADHPLFHIPSLINALDALYVCESLSESANIGRGGWPEFLEPFPYNGDFEQFRGQNATPISIFTATFHIFMVFTLASIIRTREKTFDFAPNQFYKVAMAAAEQTFSTVSIASLQATLCLAVHSLLNPAEVNIWTLTHIAMAHCVDLGLHRDPRVGELSGTAITVRRTLFYYVYHLDRSVATIQGRPLGIRDETFDVQMPTGVEIKADALPENYEFLSPDVPVSGLVQFALHRFRLDPIISEIKMLFYHLPNQRSCFSWPRDLSGEQARIRRALDQWNTELSELAVQLNTEYQESRQNWAASEMKLRFGEVFRESSHPELQ
ncbi:hypothetical protein, variant [Verruconis gallopava]|uniref:Zn(2)-C6 fungal-type domain-containing protein n=1 Tax=Verruconis gallopava TaxID=253628 RepID=A0A0D2ANT6_9PEZI|nr:hypothetical protein, variant [Verruconis gallopava]KIW08195.1 hypothetical protein, variant [Verruconis gallopava]